VALLISTALVTTYYCGGYETLETIFVAAYSPRYLYSAGKDRLSFYHAHVLGRDNVFLNNGHTFIKLDITPLQTIPPL
jgi:hypothetical protein